MTNDIELLPEEDPEAYKTLHIILKSPSSSFSQSVYSVPFNGKLIPNRDYPYEGLSMMIGSENWHILDGVALGSRGDLIPEKVIASHERVLYLYRMMEGWLEAEYRLSERGDLVIDLRSEERITMEPLFDIRHMYDRSRPHDHHVITLDRGFITEKDGVEVFFLSDGLIGFEEKNDTTGWYYKLGSGGLWEGGFLGEERELFIPAVLELEPPCRVLISRDENPDVKLRVFDRGLTPEDRSLLSFGIFWDGVLHFAAGDFWFRTVWFRDEFEGLLWNMERLIELGKRDNIREIIFHTFSHMKEGRLPNRVREYGGELDFNASDTLLLGYLVSERFLDLAGWKDYELMSMLLEKACESISFFMDADPDLVGGGPLLHPSGLLAVVSYHSWIDSIIDGWPSRLPDEWRGRCEFNKPRFFLPEINAQWIRMLLSCMRMTEALGEDNDLFEGLFERAKRSYHKLLWDGYPVYLMDTDGKVDRRLGSPAVVSFSLLKGILFEKEDVIRFLDKVEERLLVKRGDDAFGVGVVEGERGYKGERDYHRGVVWPRDTPYLIDLLRWVGREKMISEILRSNYAH
ncbi:MAG TPA: hypothetical protein ENG09_07500, partial [Candidatus Syntrophoarchaeum butanivorans]|nr:hypothetical protein [Candidatus Syntrophoarchaeum butanivorans]